MNRETHKIYKYLCEDSKKYKYLQKYKIGELNELIPDLYQLVLRFLINRQKKNNYHRFILYEQKIYIRAYLNLLDNRIDIFFDCEINDPMHGSKKYLLEKHTNLTLKNIEKLECNSFNQANILPIQLFKIKDCLKKQYTSHYNLIVKCFSDKIRLPIEIIYTIYYNYIV